MNLETLKTELREFIKLSEEETQWKVSRRKGGVFICAADKVGLPTDVCRLYQCSRTEPRAAFIARSRNISPPMAKMLLAAVEGLGRLYDDTEGYADGAPDASGHDRLCNEVSHAAKHQLNKLIKLWEETK